jgi:tRNA (guanine-N7-)-methyltransferase
MKARYLSLAPFILWPHAERPIDWPRRFGRDAPLEVEIGFGNGEFLIHQAHQAPERNFVGIELEWGSVQRGLRRIAQTRVNNVRLLLVDARVALQRLFRPQTLSRARSLFPCPWPKERHSKHRLFSQAFLMLLNSRLVPDGAVHIVTDHAGYTQWLLEQVPDTGFTVHWQAISARFSTKYERKWQAQGQEQFYEISLQKRTSLQRPVYEDFTVQIHCVESFDPERFQPVGARGEVAVEFKDFLYDPKRQRGMVWVFVTEETFRQDFWIEVAYATGRWYIRPARGCAVVPTMGVQRALDLVRDAVRQ